MYTLAMEPYKTHTLTMQPNKALTLTTELKKTHTLMINPLTRMRVGSWRTLQNNKSTTHLDDRTVIQDEGEVVEDAAE